MLEVQICHHRVFICERSCFDSLQSALEFRHNFFWGGGFSPKLLVSEVSRLYHKELVAERIVFPKNAVLTSGSVIGDS